MWALLWKSVHLPSPDTWLEEKPHTFLKSLGGRWSCLLGSVWIITRFSPLQCCLHTSLCWDSPIITKNLRSIKIFQTNCKMTKEKLFLRCPKFASVKIRFFSKIEGDAVTPKWTESLLQYSVSVKRKTLPLDDLWSNDESLQSWWRRLPERHTVWWPPESQGGLKLILKWLVACL